MDYNVEALQPLHREAYNQAVTLPGCDGEARRANTSAGGGGGAFRRLQRRRILLL